MSSDPFQRGWAPGWRSQPDLPQDFGGVEVAREALLAGGAEAAVDRTAGLRRHAQRATPRLGNEHGLDRVAAAHVEQPLAGGIAGGVVLQHAGGPDEGLILQALAKDPRQVRHGRPVGNATLVHPAHQLLGAEGFFAQAGTEFQKALAVQPQQVDGAGSLAGHGRGARHARGSRRTGSTCRAGGAGCFCCALWFCSISRGSRAARAASNPVRGTGTIGARRVFGQPGTGQGLFTRRKCHDGRNGGA